MKKRLLLLLLLFFVVFTVNGENIYYQLDLETTSEEFKININDVKLTHFSNYEITNSPEPNFFRIELFDSDLNIIETYLFNIPMTSFFPLKNNSSVSESNLFYISFPFNPDIDIVKIYLVEDNLLLLNFSISDFRNNFILEEESLVNTNNISEELTEDFKKEEEKNFLNLWIVFWLLLSGLVFYLIYYNFNH